MNCRHGWPTRGFRCPECAVDLVANPRRSRPANRERLELRARARLEVQMASLRRMIVVGFIDENGKPHTGDGRSTARELGIEFVIVEAAS